MKIPAAIPTTAPLSRLVTFSEISVLASSISSRMIRVARSETSETAWPKPLLSGSGGKALQQLGEDEAAEERAPDQGLRMLFRKGAGCDLRRRLLLDLLDGGE